MAGHDGTANDSAHGASLPYLRLGTALPTIFAAAEGSTVISLLPRVPDTQTNGRHSHHDHRTDSSLTPHLAEIVHCTAAVWGAILVARPPEAPLLISSGPVPAMVERLSGDPAQLTALVDSHLGETIRQIPLTVNGSSLGVLLLGFERSERLDARQQALQLLLADGLAQRLQSEQQQRRIARLTSQLAIINQLGQQINWIRDRQQLVEQITSLIYQTLDYDHIHLLLINEEHKSIDLIHASGPLGEQLLREGFSERLDGNGIVSWVASSGRIWIANDISTDPHYRPHRMLPNIGAEIALPLKVDKRIIGVLDIQNDRQRIFDSDDLFLLQIVADQVASALEHARLFETEHHERELATTLSDVSRIICSSLELDQVLDLILQQIDRVVPHIGTRITLLTEGTQMRVVAAKGCADNEEAKLATFEITQAPLAPLIMYERETVVVRDAISDPRWIWLPGAKQVRSWCGTPLIIKDRPIGFLCVDWGEPDFYTEAHARIVRAFADQAAVAIENAQLYTTIKSFSEQLEHKVGQRTIELRHAHNEIATKAEQLRALVCRVVQIQESERQRIAHDLHDSVTQAILGAIYELQALRRRIGGQRTELIHPIDECRQLLEHTLVEMKTIIYALRPRALDELGLLAALENFVAASSLHYGLEITFQVSGSAYPLTDDVELAIYRIVQEATQNSFRHAAARSMTIGVEFRPRQLRVTVVDDGHGFDPTQVGDGLGILGIRERAQALGGQLMITSQIGQGTRITLDLQRSIAERLGEL